MKTRYDEVKRDLDASPVHFLRAFNSAWAFVYGREVVVIHRRNNKKGPESVWFEGIAFGSDTAEFPGYVQRKICIVLHNPIFGPKGDSRLAESEPCSQ
jgi:hypothetical protein